LMVRTRTLIALPCAILALIGSTAVANASAATAPESCRMLIKKIPGQNGKTRVVSTECSSDPSSLKAFENSTKLVTFYADIRYGIPFREVWADDGPCDGEGYHLPELENLNDSIGGVSSYIISNDCDDQIYYYEEDFEGDRKSNRWDCPWVGDRHNDHLYSMKLWHS
jgi:hypothetical protein